MLLRSRVRPTHRHHNTAGFDRARAEPNSQTPWSPRPSRHFFNGHVATHEGAAVLPGSATGGAGGIHIKIETHAGVHCRGEVAQGGWLERLTLCFERFWRDGTVAPNHERQCVHDEGKFTTATGCLEVRIAAQVLQVLSEGLRCHTQSAVPLHGLAAGAVGGKTDQLNVVGACAHRETTLRYGW